MMDDTRLAGIRRPVRGLYRTHPVRVSIAGSTESIAQITPETLYACHRAFYSPKNMALVICGTADFDEACRIAAQFSPQDAPEIGRRHYGTRRGTVNELTVTRCMQVSQPQFLLGFKDIPLEPDESRLRRSLLGELAVRILCGDNSPLYASLYEKRLIGRDFDTDYTVIPEEGGRHSRRREPRSGGGPCRGRAGGRALAHEGGGPRAFLPHEKSRVRPAPARAGRARKLCAAGGRRALFAGEHYLDFAALFDTISPDDVGPCSPAGLGATVPPFRSSSRSSKSTKQQRKQSSWNTSSHSRGLARNSPSTASHSRYSARKSTGTASSSASALSRPRST